jgi:hypothetical protein
MGPWIEATMGEKNQTDTAVRRPPRLQDWHSWLDNTIAEAEQRGDFDNLSGHGKPLHFDANPLTGEIDVGHGLLKSAGMAPAWIELDKEIRAGLDGLKTLRDETARHLSSLAACPVAEDRHPAPTPRRSWWRALLGRRRPPAPTRAEAHDERRYVSARIRVRAVYLDRAEEVDRKIAAFNAALPAALWHLERARLPEERAARDFDEVCPPPGSSWVDRDQP